MIFSMIFFTIHKISYYRVRVSTGSVEIRWLGGSFLMVYRNNAGRLGSGFISVSLETRWLGHLGGFYVPACFGSGKGEEERAWIDTNGGKNNTEIPRVAEGGGERGTGLGSSPGGLTRSGALKNSQKSVYY